MFPELETGLLFVGPVGEEVTVRGDIPEVILGAMASIIVTSFLSCFFTGDDNLTTAPSTYQARGLQLMYSSKG